MKKLKILVAEDDEITRENSIEYLEDIFEDILEAKDGLEAYELYKKHSPDIIISDIQMPKINGLELIEKIRKDDETTQIIIATAYCSKEYLLKAVELGLVKYLVKPIEEKELEKAIELCCNNLKGSNIIALKDNYIFDAYNKTLIFNNEIVKLRTKELLLLELLVKNKNRFVTYNEIENFVWEEDVMSKDAIKTLIKNLKLKLPSDSIENLSGTGYKIAL